jgi:hypothetical protein
MRVQVKLECKKAAEERHRRENVKSIAATTTTATAAAAATAGTATDSATTATHTSSRSVQRPASAGVSRTEITATAGAAAVNTSAGVGSSKTVQRRPSTADAHGRRMTATASNECAVQQLQQQLRKFSQSNSSKQRASMMVANGKTQAVHCGASSGTAATASASATAIAGATATTTRFAAIRDADDAGVEAMLKVLLFTNVQSSSVACVHYA